MILVDYQCLQDFLCKSAKKCCWAISVCGKPTYRSALPTSQLCEVLKVPALLFPAYIWSVNLFFFCFSTGPGTCCPSSHVQEFRGNSVSYAKRGQPTETHEKRLGHPSNQCPWELAGPIPTRASPGNVFDSTACMHTHTSLVAFKRDSLCLIWQPCRLTIALSCVQGDGELTDVRRVSFTFYFFFLFFFSPIFFLFIL